MKEWARRRKVWVLAGAFVLFLFAFQAIENLVGPTQETVTTGEATEPAPEPEPIAIEVERLDEETVLIQVGATSIRTRFEDEPTEEVDALYACVVEAVEELRQDDPALMEATPSGWLDRRDHERQLSREVQRVHQDCLAKAGD